MIRRKNLSLVALLALVLLLAACGQNQPPVTGTPSPDGFVTLSLGLEGEGLSPQSLTPQGVPYDSAGDAAVELVDVEVIDRNGQTVEFEVVGGVYTAADGGAITRIPLTKAASAVQLALLEDGNPYTFRAVGFHEDVPGGSVIAYDSQNQDVTDDSQVVLSLTAVLGDAVFTPRYPTNFVRSGDVLDLMLVVMANGHDDFAAGDYLQVPMGDFTFDATDLVVSGASVLNSSNRGVRIEVGGTCTGEVAVSGGSVTGLVEESGDFTAGNIDIPSFALDCPGSEGTVTTDTENPEVTLTFDRASGLAEGTASDNHRIADVRIFDGTVLVASTDDSEIGGDVAEVVFIAGTNEFRALITAEPIGGLIAVATDPSGNEGWSAETARVFVGEGGTGDGSEDAPFGSLAAALAAVDDGGTVYVGEGTFEEQLSLTKNVTVVGAGSGLTVIQAPETTVAPVSALDGDHYPIVNIGNGAEVSISGVTVSGPFPAGTPCQVSGVRVAENAVLHLSDSDVANVNTDRSCQGATAILVGRDADAEVGTAYLTNVNVTVDSPNAKAGIVVDGPGSYLSFVGGSVTALNITQSGDPAQNGIQISRGANGLIDGVTISGFDYAPNTWGGSGVLLYMPGDDLRVENSQIDNNDLGLAYYNEAGHAGAASVTLRNTSFDGNNWHIVNQSLRSIDATQGISFGGVTPNASTDLATLFQIENLIDHAIDGDDAGLVRVVPGHLYVTNDRSIQRALDVAASGDIVHVQEGEYTPGATLDIATPWVELRAAGNATLRGENCSAAGFTAVNLAATGASVNGFRVEDFSTVGMNDLDGFIHAIGNQTSVLNMDIEIDPACRVDSFVYEVVLSGDDVTVEGNTITRDTSNGLAAIYFNEKATPDRTTIRGNTVTGGAIGGMVAAPSPTISITDNTVTGAFHEGIWLAATTDGPVLGFENATFTISGNEISGSGAASDITLHVVDGAVNTVNGLTDPTEIVDELESSNGATAALQSADPRP